MKWVVVVVLAACGDDAVVHVDAAPADTAAMTIHGTGSTFYVTDTGLVEVPRAFASSMFTSITPEAGGFEHRTGTGDDDGTFTVDVGRDALTWDFGFVVPNSPLQYLVGAVVMPNLGQHVLGRPDQAQGTASITLTASGLAPWGTRDDLQIITPNAGALVFSPQIDFGTPALGATAITNKVFEWNAPLAVAAKGDTTMLVQLATKTSGTENYAAITKAGSVSDFTITNGQPAALTVALADVPQKSLTVHWKRSQWNALLADAGPLATFGATAFDVDALPGANTRGIYASSPDLVELIVPIGSTDLDETFQYGDPFPSWDEFIFYRQEFLVPYQAAGATTPATMPAVMFAAVPVGVLESNAGTLAPAITGVRSLQIAGHDASLANAGVGLTPTITWLPPATGVPTAYIVEIFRISNFGGSTKISPVAFFTTAETSLHVPDQTLTSGDSFVLKVATLFQPGAVPTSAPFLGGSLQYFEVATAQFQP